jgi:hypothetical protein
MTAGRPGRNLPCPRPCPPPLFDPFAPGFTDDPYPQYAALRAAAPNAVEELLRYDSPVQASRRITLEPVSISGVCIPAGAFVMASLGMASAWTADRTR